MGKEKILILDKERINWKMQRMAYEVWENFSNCEELTIIGVEGSGNAVAGSLARRLGEISPLKVEVISMKVNKKEPLKDTPILEQSLDGKAVLLVDDVANSGRTLLYALKPVLDFCPDKIMVAVLVDRKHKSYPIMPDIVGHSISTTLQEQIEVETEGNYITAAYLQ